jgi:hypothetical protein
MGMVCLVIPPSLRVSPHFRQSAWNGKACVAKMGGESLWRSSPIFARLAWIGEGWAVKMGGESLWRQAGQVFAGVFRFK